MDGENSAENRERAATEAKPPVARSRFWRLVVTGSVLASLPTLFSLGARWYWRLELLTHFCVQYAVVTGGFALLLLAGRRWRAALLPASAAVFNLVLIVPLWIAPSRGEHTAPATRVLVANVYTGNREFQRLLDVIDREQPAIILVTETDERWLKALEPLREKYPHVFSKSRADNFGIGIYSRIPLTQTKLIHLGDSKVPAIVAVAQVNGVSVTIFGVHTLPPADREYATIRNSQLADLARRVRVTKGPVLVLGDLNTTSWSPQFADLISETGLKDSRTGFGVQATWPTANRLLSITLDHALVSETFVVIDHRIGPEIGSDHLPVIVDVALSLTADEPSR